MPFYKESLISILLALTYLFIFIYRKTKILILKEYKNVYIIISIFCTCMCIDMIVGLLSNTLNVSIVLYTFKVILFFLVCILQISCRNFANILKLILSSHTHVVIILSLILFCLILSFDGINTSFIDTGFLKKNSEGNLGENLYSFPYGLGLFIVGQNHAQFGLLKFPQYCSFYFEPQFFCFFYYPFLFIYLSYLKSLRAKLFLLLISLTISFFVFSLTNIISLFITFVFFFRKYFMCYKLLYLVLIVIFIFAFNLIPYFSMEELSLLRKFNSSSSNDTLGIYYELFYNFDILGKSFNSVNISSINYDTNTKFSIISTLGWVILYIKLFIMIFVYRNSNPYISAALIYILISILKTPNHALPSVVICVLIITLKNSMSFTFEKIRYSF